MTPASAITWLFVPGDRPDRFGRAVESGADAVILDLQDAVAAGAKQAARDAVLQALGSGFTGCVRINPPATSDGQADLAALGQLVAAAGAASAAPIALMVPLAASTDDLDAVARACPGVPVVPLIESAAGAAALPALARHPATVRLAFGNLDMAADLGCPPDSGLLDQLRASLVVQSRVAGLPQPIDGVVPDHRHDEQAAAAARRARDWGFGGMLCIHPRQVAVVAEAFAPTADEVAWAQRVLVAGDPAQGGASSVDGVMVDGPVFRRAEWIVQRAAGQASTHQPEAPDV